MKTPIQLVYLNDDDSDTNSVAVDTSGFKSKEALSKKYGMKVRDVIIIAPDVTERFDKWPTDRLLSDS